MNRRRKNTGGFFNSYVLLLCSFIVACMVVFSYARAYYQEYQVQSEIQKLKKDADQLESKKIELLEALQYVQSTGFIEEKARTELNMVKKGEKTMIIQAGNDNLIAGNMGNGQEKEVMIVLHNISNYRKWWNIFMENN
ncbi:MAG: septum formation initiator family protein [bacterium]